MNKTSISWVRGPDGLPGYTWSPIIGCRHASKGCANCWAERLAATRLERLPAYAGLTRNGRWTGEQRFLPERLAQPLRKRTPAGIFVCDMSDLFGEGVTNEQIAAVYGVMAACPQHLFYVCTKRARRRREWFEWLATRNLYDTLFEAVIRCTYDERSADAINRTYAPSSPPLAWPLPNVIELTSVEDQATADERIPDALATPAAVRGLSMEPLIGRVWLNEVLMPDGDSLGTALFSHGIGTGIDWVVCGCESGPNARPMEHEWAASIWRECLSAGVPFFFKQEMANGKLDHAPTLEGRIWRQFPRSVP